MEREEVNVGLGKPLSDKVAAAFFTRLKLHGVRNYQISNLLGKSRSYISMKSRGAIPIRWDDIAALAEFLPDTTPEQLLLQIAQEINNLPSTPPPPVTTQTHNPPPHQTHHPQDSPNSQNQQNNSPQQQQK